MSTTSYITLPIETDSTTLAIQMMQDLMTAYPGWIPHEGNLEVWLIEIFARIEAETRDVASLVPAEIFRYFGKSVMNIPAIEGAPATAQSTWTMRDDAGYSIPAGTVVVYRPTGDQQAYFRTLNDVIVAPGQSTTADGEVTLVAINVGSAGNGLPAEQVNLVDALLFVTSIVSTATTSGGIDPETDDAYLNRLRGELKLLSPRPILTSDFATLALNISGIGRAVGIDGYNPNDNSFNNERMVAVAVTDASGRPVSAIFKNQVDAYLESKREANFVVNVIDPAYTTVDVEATVAVLPGSSSATTIALATQAVQDYLDPSSWNWDSVIRYNELIALLSNVPGVDYVGSLLRPSQDLALNGTASLPIAGSISIFDAASGTPIVSQEG